MHKPKGARLIPYTLWGEIAYQTGGGSLYGQIEKEACSHAAPAKFYFDTVFEGKKAEIKYGEKKEGEQRYRAVRSRE